MPPARSGRSLRTLQAIYPQRLSIVALDVSDAGAIRAAHETVHSQTESLDTLINNAGIYSSHGSDEPLERLGKLSFEDARLLRVNAVAPLLVAQQFLGRLRAARGAKLINISSGYGSVSANTGVSVLLQRQQGRAQHVHTHAGGGCQALGHHHGVARPWLGEHEHGRPRAPAHAPEGGGLRCCVLLMPDPQP